MCVTTQRASLWSALYRLNINLHSARRYELEIRKSSQSKSWIRTVVDSTTATRNSGVVEIHHFQLTYLDDMNLVVPQMPCDEISTQKH